MIKKILIVILIGVASFLLATPKIYAVHEMNMNAKTEEFDSERVAIDIKQSHTTITINHTSGKEITHAIVEYVFLEDNKKISMLTTYNVSNNEFTISASVIALKVHQVKVLRGSTYYRHMTTNNNTIGSLEGVERRNIDDIRTVAVKTVKTKWLTGPSSSIKKYYEFYLQFDKEHDQLRWIDAEFVLTKKIIIFIPTERENVTQRISINGNLQEYTKRETMLGIPSYQTKFTSIKTLEKNTNSKIKANYVARIQPANGIFETMANADISNFAIIRVAYVIDGEFIVDDVINNPTDPKEDIVQDTIDYMQQLLDMFKDFEVWFNDLTAGFNKNIKTILIVAGIIVFFLLIGPIVSLVKLIWAVIKLPFKALKKSLSILKWLLVPKKQNKSKNQNYGGKNK